MTKEKDRTEEILKLIYISVEKNPDIYPKIIETASLAFTNYKKKVDHSMSSIHFFINFLSKKVKKDILKKINKEMFPKYIIDKLNQHD
jgi:hypothetical protein